MDSKAEEDQRAIVEGSDLPLKMPVASLSELDLPARILANGGQRQPTTLESFAGPIVGEGRDLMLVGAAQAGTDQFAPFLMPLLGRLASSEAAGSPKSGGAAARQDKAHDGGRITRALLPLTNSNIT